VLTEAFIWTGHREDEEKEEEELLVSTVPFEVVRLGTVANSAQGDYFDGHGENYKLRIFFKGHIPRIFLFTLVYTSIIIFLTGHNTLRRHLHLMRLTDHPLCRSVERRMKPLPTFSIGVRFWSHSGMRI
jgi:hypothetical protein